MDKADTILAALEKLAATVATKTDVARLEARIGHLEADVSGLKTDVSGLKAGQARLEADVSLLKTDVSVLKVGQARILEHLDVAELKGRVEEQSRAIASLIPTRVAAVPGR